MASVKNNSGHHKILKGSLLGITEENTNEL
jgi:hypothetical protein